MLEVILNWLSSLTATAYITAFGLLVSSIFVFFVLNILSKSLNGVKLDGMMKDQNGKFSQHHFWSNIAYFLASIAFIKYNFTTEEVSYIVEIWIIYLTVIGGVDVFSSWIKYKTNVKTMYIENGISEINQEQKEKKEDKNIVE